MDINQIQKGLSKYRPIEKRWEKLETNGYSFINDSYNANPESMKAFIDTVFDLYNNSTIILGDMSELGENEVQYHKELGEYINNHKKLASCNKIYSVGTLSKNITKAIKNINAEHFDNIEQIITEIKQNVDKNSIIFLKASRSMKFENIIEQI